MKYFFLTITFFLTVANHSFAQMWNGQDSLYGNEWIAADAEFYKFNISEDGIYRIDHAAMVAAGFPINMHQGLSLRVYAFGTQVPIYVTTNGFFGGSDYLEFYGEKNKSQLDQYLFDDPEEDQLNPDFSLVSDRAAYYLTWDGPGAPARYETVANNLSGAGSPANFFLHTSSLNYHSKLYSFQDNNNVKFSHYDQGEGFAGSASRNHDLKIPTPFKASSGPASQLEVRMSSSLSGNSSFHDMQVSFNGAIIKNDQFGGVRMIKINEIIDNQSLLEENTLKVDGLKDGADQYAISVAKITYPRTFDFGGADFFQFTLAGSAQQYLEINNFAATGSPVLYDVTNHKRIITDVTADIVKVNIPAGAANRKIALSGNGAAINSVSTLSKVNMQNLATSDANYIIISHPTLNNNDGGTNPVEDYANFRSSIEGGSYNVKVININDILEVFGYGIERHPIAIRNFTNYIHKYWTNPEMIFLLGKGRDYAFTRTDAELGADANSSFYIPTMGTPGSDNLMVAGPNSNIPLIPVGRLAASTKEQVTIYLNKMKDMAAAQNGGQTIEERAWMKNIMHLAGGGVGDQASIATNLRNFERIIEEEGQFGAEVTTFYKTSSDPVQISESEAIFDLINNGVSMITFFGHSSPGTFDFNIDNPDNYANQGKLPLLVSMGCYSGNIHSSGEGISERFVFYEGKAASSFYATTGPGYIPSLRNFGNEFYKVLGDTHYGEPLGKILKESLKPLDGVASIAIRSLVQQLTLNGDPAILMNPHPGPDYVVDGKSVSFEPAVLNAQLDSFDMMFDVVNLGSVSRDSFQLLIEQRLPTGEKFTLRSDRMAAPFAKKRITERLPNYGSVAAGLNRFFVKVDTNDEIDELPSPLAEMNNTLIGADNQEGHPVFIFDNSLEPLFPADFGIVNDDQPVKLVCSTRDALVAEQDWLIELDTTENFNSPLKMSEKFTQMGGVLSWEPPMSWEEERVYYWRVSPDSTSAEQSYIWKKRSFVYLADSEPGWNQSHYYQWKQNEFEGMEVKEGGEFEYLTNGFFITMKNKVNEPNDEPQYIYNFGNSAVSVRPWNWLNSGIAFVVGDSTTGGGWYNPAGGYFGSYNPSGSLTFAFPTNTQEERKLVMDFIENEIPDKHYVFCFTVIKDQNQDFKPEEWLEDENNLGKSIFTALEDQGAMLARELASSGSKPYTIVFRKNDYVLSEDLAADFNSTIITEVFIPILRSSGAVQSTIIGPAKTWLEFEWEIGDSDGISDSSAINIFGLNVDGTIDTLIENSIDDNIDLSFINPDLYPRLNIQLYSEDEDIRTASNLHKWRVTYESYPDLALDAAKNVVIYKDTLQEGELFKFETAITNTSQYEINNTEIVATFSNNGESIQKTMGLQNLAPGESTNALFELETLGHTAQNNLLIEVNPSDNPKEKFRFNNVGTYNFYVSADNTNPLMEVTFDGIPIMNGDIVSAKPQITIRLKDENPYLTLTDTSVLKMILIDPNQNTSGIAFSSPNVNFIPAEQGKNEAYIEWSPSFDLDGDYQLFVQGEDVTGNQSGALDYKVNFKIINKKMVSNVLNYPNPFSTSTRFVYTLTGDETPAYFKIQIFSAAGKIVKEITQDELGPMKVGTHQTDYIWTGTDDFGDRLANGVYFYKVITKNAQGENYESFINGSVDQFFDQGFGKLVIMR